MKIVAKYSLKDGEEALKNTFPQEYEEIEEIIGKVDAKKCLKKISKEKTMPGKTLYSPMCLNKEFETQFLQKNWQKIRVNCCYSSNYYVPGYGAKLENKAYREMDFVKAKVGVEVQFGKYAFMVYNICAKMTIFHNLKYIDIGVEIVPTLSLQREMSTGVSYFEQLVWDLEKRGVADIDIPVLVLGIDI